MSSNALHPVHPLHNNPPPGATVPPLTARERAIQIAELHEIVLDFLHDDKRTLLDTAIVCKDWCPPSRKRLFSTIQFRGELPGGPVGADFFPFFEIIARKDIGRESKPLGTYIRSLCLRSAVDQPLMFQMESWLQLETLQAILSYLPNLRHLVLFEVRIRGYDYRDRAYRNRPRPLFQRSLETLALRDVTIEPADERRSVMGTIVEVLDSFKKVDNLVIRNCLKDHDLDTHARYPKPEELDRITTLARSLQVKSLQMGETPFCGSILEILRLTPSRTTLRSLILSYVSSQDVWDFTPSFGTMCKGLQTFELDLREVKLCEEGDASPEHLWSRSTLSSCASLRKLNVHISLDPYDPNETPTHSILQFRSFLQFISSAPRSIVHLGICFSPVTFSINFPSPQDYADFVNSERPSIQYCLEEDYEGFLKQLLVLDWEGFKGMLADSTMWRELKRVTFSGEVFVKYHGGPEGSVFVHREHALEEKIQEIVAAKMRGLGTRIEVGFRKSFW